MNVEKTKRVYWVDVAKLAAIIAVMVDHASYRLYQNPQISFYSYYSVSLFVILMGITSYWSYNRRSNCIVNKLKKSSWKIIRPYIIATFIYSIIIDGRFDFDLFVSRIIHFNACSPFYYVLLYLQLLILVPLLYRILNISTNRVHNCIIILVSLIVIVVISFLTTNYTNIMNIYGGGGRLFGGTYLVLVYLGMIIGKYCSTISIENKIAAWGFFILSVTLTILWACFVSVNRFKLDSFLPFGNGLNPPSVSLCLYALLVTCTFYFSEEIISDKLMETIAWMGKHTLYIFLYHVLFINILNSLLDPIYLNIWIRRLVYFLAMIVGSIIIEFILERLHVIICNIFFGEKAAISHD